MFEYFPRDMPEKQHNFWLGSAFDLPEMKIGPKRVILGSNFQVSLLSWHFKTKNETFTRFLPCFYLFYDIICLSLKHKKFHSEFTWTVAKLCGSKNAEMLGNALDSSWREKWKSVWHTHPNFALWLLLVEEEFLDLPKLKVELLSSSSSRSSSSVNRLARSGSFFRISSSVWSIFD